VVFVVRAVLAPGVISTGVISDYLAAVAAISIGWDHSERRAPTSPRDIPISSSLTQRTDTFLALTLRIED
jgi:hypothetical protein